MNIILGDCVEKMAGMEACSVDAIVTDPPYGLEFMGKEWDSFANRGDLDQTDAWDRPRDTPFARRETPRYGGKQLGEKLAPNQALQAWTTKWAAEAFRVLKPGGHLLAFGGTRTYHRLAAGIEDAGFEIRDCLAWMYGSGFPKSLDVSKAIDKAAGVEREVIGITRRPDGTDRPNASAWNSGMGYMGNDADPRLASAPATEDAARWQGWGTALKPAFEPVVVARKPLAGTVAANVLAHGVGAINVDACRIEGGPKGNHGRGGEISVDGRERPSGFSMGAGDPMDGFGRWPANVILGHSPDCVEVGSREVRGTGHFPASRAPSTFGRVGTDGESRGIDETVEVWECIEDCPVRLLDEQTGERPAGAAGTRTGENEIYGKLGGYDVPWGSYGDTGGASRFFYCAKTSRAERNAGLDGFERPMLWSSGEQNPGSFQAEGTEKAARNNHPTVKPIDLMRWLLRLVVPPGGLILDPFLGSGSTGCAAALEGFDFVGIELDPDYLAIAEARIRFWEEHGDDGLRIVQERAAGERVRTERAAAGQMDLLAMTDPE